MKPLAINPPLLNSSNSWCTNLEQLRELYDCPHTGAVTTRTSLLHGFAHDPAVHQYTFFNPSTHNASSDPTKASTDETGSLNTLGYSPIPLKEYLSFIKSISDNTQDVSTPNSSSSPSSPIPRSPKPFIISVTGSADEVLECYRLITAQQQHVHMPLAMEINLSCPNISSKPPPAYHSHRLTEYLSVLKTEIATQLQSLPPSSQRAGIHVPIGIKTPPYTYADQFQHLINALLASAKAEPKDQPCPISFITATNTLGSSLLLTPTLETPSSPMSEIPSRPREVLHHTLNSATGTGIGGLAGAPLHPLALGNVYTIKGLLFQHRELEHVQIIGVGGVEDVEGFKRMRAVGAAAVGVGTALGRKGVKVFEEIGEALALGRLHA
ncbi:FMN-linked oxidoreductase [Lepidopterella palustris CBS 459.81]|uniref:Dihydroorotate dehydrogenase (fumarate) n=1 Tax=Lepidopterella palustris CBS 459.81 TaxID=1314670 RepID=A0A8E2EFQ2_9PEZI|nr:FMN-linked oxidoreductase [Lepidopterella palustris CBS 459.81]